jgi:GrpB-like predicted nucleotidyltransferase (UPF0157 family)
MHKSLEARVAEAIREEISLVPYDPEWPNLFQSEREFLNRTLPKSLIGRIEHFGSTAVPGLLAKPIIDILVEVSSLAETRERIVPLLEAQGYDYFWRLDCTPSYAWFIKRKEGRRTHHIHMVEPNSVLWERLYFRDYLKEFADEARRYADLKQSLATKYARDRVSYSEGKSEYVISTTEKAKSYYGKKAL